MAGSASFDFAIIGGGIVGTATAMALTDSVRCSVIILETEQRLADHQTGNNSGVIHSGLYYRPGSSKARNCVTGREALYRYCREHGIPHDRCGKIVVAVEEDEIPALRELERRGRANGLTEVQWLSPQEIEAREPHIRGVAGLFVPDTGIVDYRAVTESFADRVRDRGGTIRTCARVFGCHRHGKELLLDTAAGHVRCRFLINCGGLHSDRIARFSGVNPGLAIVPFRGEYYSLKTERRYMVQNLVYPVPDPRFPFLGVHFTRMIDGSVEAGPNAVLAFKREGYRRFDVSAGDLLQYALYGGFWKMALKYWRMGLNEYRRSLSKEAFVSALRRLMPGIESADLDPASAGVRAQALDPDGRLVDDFRIVEADRMIHVLNAPSPAATASISIGKHIAERAQFRYEEE